MDVFIDTNILIALYRLSSEDLEGFKKIYVLLENKKINILLTKQVKNEFFRIRDDVIFEAIKKFKEQSLKLNVPAIFRADEEFESLKLLKDKYNKQHQNLLRKIETENQESSLQADEVVHYIINKSNCLEITDDIFNKAQKRHALGNPPGKNNTLGDQVNWEILLENNSIEDLHLISADGDYFHGNTSEIKRFLKNEWLDKKNTQIFGYRTLSDFFSTHYPNIKLASELNQELLISKLINSTSFGETHQSIYKLKKIESFTPQQIGMIADGFLQNNQLNWIATDPDVSEFILMLITQYSEQIEKEKLYNLSKLISKDDEDDN